MIRGLLEASWLTKRAAQIGPVPIWMNSHWSHWVSYSTILTYAGSGRLYVLCFIPCRLGGSWSSPQVKGLFSPLYYPCLPYESTHVGLSGPKMRVRNACVPMFLALICTNVSMQSWWMGGADLEMDCFSLLVNQGARTLCSVGKSLPMTHCKQ